MLSVPLLTPRSRKDSRPTVDVGTERAGPSPNSSHLLRKVPEVTGGLQYRKASTDPTQSLGFSFVSIVADSYYNRNIKIQIPVMPVASVFGHERCLPRPDGASREMNQDCMHIVNVDDQN